MTTDAAYRNFKQRQRERSERHAAQTRARATAKKLTRGGKTQEQRYTEAMAEKITGKDRA